MRNDDDAFLNSPFHATIVAKTGRGKTVVANAIASATKRIAVVLNTQAKGYIRGQRIRYSGPQDDGKVNSAIRRGARMLNIIPETDDGTRELHGLKDLFWPLAEGDVDVSFYVDEAQDIDPDLLVRLHKRGRDPGPGEGGIKMHSISQRFTSIPKSARTETTYTILVGVPDDGDESMLKSQKSVPFDQICGLHSRAKWLREVKGGEYVSHAFSVVKDGEIVFGPTMAAPRYAD